MDSDLKCKLSPKVNTEQYLSTKVTLEEQFKYPQKGPAELSRTFSTEDRNFLVKEGKANEVDTLRSYTKEV